MSSQVYVEIKGISPLLMHAYPLAGEPDGFKNWPPDKQAEFAAYRDPEGKLYVPGSAMWRCLVDAAAFSKGKGRASLQKPVAACVLVSPERLILTPQTYGIDARSVVNPSTGGRIVRYRPRFDQWAISFWVEYDLKLVSEVQLKRIVDDAGQLVGLLDFRPACKGPFGRFMVVTWQPA